MNDLKFALRQLLKNPGFTVVAVASVALGLTLNSAVFSLVDGLWLRSRPFADPNRVLRIFGGSESLRADTVSRHFFSVSGIKPHVGRFFSENDEPDLKNTPAIILSHRLWQRRFSGDASLIRKPVVLTGQSVIVLGIAPPDFNGLARLNAAEVWYPVETWRVGTSRNDRSMGVVGRLKAGYSVEQARAEVEAIFDRLELKDAASGAPRRLWFRRRRVTRAAIQGPPPSRLQQGPQLAHLSFAERGIVLGAEL